MNGGTIVGNDILEHDIGGGIYAEGGTLVINGGKIRYNHAGNGAAVYMNSAKATISGGRW